MPRLVSALFIACLFLVACGAAGGADPTTSITEEPEGTVSFSSVPDTTTTTPETTTTTSHDETTTTTSHDQTTTTTSHDETTTTTSHDETTTTTSHDETTTTTSHDETRTDSGSAYIGTTYSNASEHDLRRWGGWQIAEVGPGPSGWDSPYSGTHWEIGSDRMLWFEKKTANERKILDVVTFPAPGPKEALAVSGCIADDQGVDAELHGVARHGGNNQWTLVMLWRADRGREVWVAMDPSGHFVEPATGSCELGAGDGALP